MDDKNLKNKYLFACIPIRLSIALLIYYLPEKYIKYTIPIFILSILLTSFKYIQYEMNNNQIGAFGQKVWWNNIRLLHIIILISYISCIYFKQDIYRIIMFIDLILGMSMYIYYK